MHDFPARPGPLLGGLAVYFGTSVTLMTRITPLLRAAIPGKLSSWDYTIRGLGHARK
jgi:hypothetical protein